MTASTLQSRAQGVNLMYYYESSQGSTCMQWIHETDQRSQFGSSPKTHAYQYWSLGDFYLHFKNTFCMWQENLQVSNKSRVNLIFAQTLHFFCLNIWDRIFHRHFRPRTKLITACILWHTNESIFAACLQSDQREWRGYLLVFATVKRAQVLFFFSLPRGVFADLHSRRFFLFFFCTGTGNVNGAFSDRDLPRFLSPTTDFGLTFQYTDTLFFSSLLFFFLFFTEGWSGPGKF